MQNSFSSIHFEGTAVRNRKKPSTRKNHALRLESLEERALLDAVPLVSSFSVNDDAQENTALVQAMSLPEESMNLESVQNSVLAAAAAEVPNEAVVGVIQTETGTYYILDFAVEGTTQRVFVAGVAEQDISNVISRMTAKVQAGTTTTMNIVGDFVDADKYSPVVSNMCWAGAVSNSLWYTGWANENTAQFFGGSMFTSEDSVLSHYGENFTNQGNETFYAGEWFIDGRFRPQEWTGWGDTRLRPGSTGGGFYSENYTLSLDASTDIHSFSANGKTIESQYPLSGGNFSRLSSMRTELENGSGVTFHISWAGGGHLISGWGYVYDTAYVSTNPNYYKGVLITDPDDNNYKGVNAPNNLKYVSLQYKNSAYYMLGYGYGSGKGTQTDGATYLLNFTALSRYESSVDLAANNSCTLSSNTVEPGSSVTLRNIYVKNVAEENSHVYTINIYASLDENITSGDILLNSYTTSDLSPNRISYLTRSFSTESLGYGTTYHIGYIIESTLDTDLSNNTGICARTLTIGPAALQVPSILSPGNTKTSVSIRVRSVPNASEYQLECSADAAFSDPASIRVQTCDSDGIYTFDGLEGGTTYYFRCKSVGDGTYYKDSAYCSVLSVTTMPYTYNLTSNTGVPLSSNTVPIGSTVTVNGILITNDGDMASGDYTLRMYASTNSTISRSDLLLAEYEMKSLDAGATETFSPVLSTDLLDTNASYYIGWMILSGKNRDNTAESGRAKGVLRVTQVSLENPTLEVTDINSTSVIVNIGEVENAGSYVIQYSIYENFRDYSTQRFTLGGTQTLTGLLPSTQYYMRCYAVGTGAFLNSGYSSIVSPETEDLGLVPTVRANGSSITVEWNRLSGATSYMLYTRRAGSDTWDEKIIYDTKTTFNAVAGWEYEVKVSNYVRTEFSDVMNITVLEKPVFGNAFSSSNTISGTITNYAQTNLDKSTVCTVTITQIGNNTANYNATMALTNGSGNASFAGTNYAVSLKNGVLTLTGLRNTTSYTCVATFGITDSTGQEVSRSAISTSLRTTTKAAEPGEVSDGITVLSVGAQSMKISWDPILLSGNSYNPQFYTVKYRNTSSTRWVTATTKAAAQVPYTLNRLAADTEYEIQVSATPVKGKTVSREVLSVTQATSILLPAAKLAKESASAYDFTVEVQNFDSTSLSRSTHAAVTITNIGNITKNLTATFALDGGTGTFAGTNLQCSFEDGKLVFTGANANTSYSLTVSFFVMQNGETTAASAACKAFKVTTLKAPYDTPVIQAHSTGVSCAEVSWNRVKGENSAMEAYSYTVQYRVSGTESWKTAASAVKGTSCTVTKLAANTAYEIRVFANKSTQFSASEAAVTAVSTWAQITKPRVSTILQGTSVVVKTGAKLDAATISGVEFKLTLSGKYSTGAGTKAFTIKNVSWDASAPYDFTYGTLTFNPDGTIRVTLNENYTSCTMRIGFNEITGILKDGTPASWSGSVNSPYFSMP